MGVILPPRFQQPSSPGAVSNVLTGDVVVVRYYNVDGVYADPPCLMGVTARDASTGVDIWDSGWIGVPTVNALADSIAADVQALIFNDFLLTLGYNINSPIQEETGIWASALAGPAVSPFTSQQSIPNPQWGGRLAVVTFPQGTYAYLVGGFGNKYSFNVPNNEVWFAMVNSDGTFGTWTQCSALLPQNLGWAQVFPFYVGVNWSGSDFALGVFGGNNAAVADGGDPLGGYDPSSLSSEMYAAFFTGTGDITYWYNLGPWSEGLAAAAWVGYGSQSIVLGGFGPSGPVDEVHMVDFSPDPGYGNDDGTTPGTRDPLPRPLCGFGACIVGSKLWLFGGWDGTSRRDEIYTADLTYDPSTGEVDVVNWTQVGSLAVASDRGYLMSYQSRGSTYLFYIGGSVSSDVIVYQIDPTAGTIIAGPWVGASSHTLDTADMGSGGSVVDNPDGSADYTFEHGFTGTEYVSPIPIGTRVSYDIQFQAKNEGYISPDGVTAITYTSPPSISNITQDGKAWPTITFQYVPGSSSQGQATFDIQLEDMTSDVLWDSGALVGRQNTVQAEPVTPLVNGTEYQIVVTVQTTDVCMPGSTMTSTATATFTASSLGTPAVPTLAVTVDMDHAALDAAVTNSVGTLEENRIYYRLHGTTPWLLLKRVYSPSEAYTQVLNDEIALNTLYDFIVTAVGTNGGESAGCTPVESISIVVPAGRPFASRYSVMVHVAGTGIAQTAGCLVQLSGGVGASYFQYTQHRDVVQQLMYGARAPATRYGPYRYVEIDCPVFFQSVAQQLLFESVLAYAQDNGLNVYWRDSMGRMYVCAPNDGTLTYDTSAFGEGAIKLIETEYTYVP